MPKGLVTNVNILDDFGDSKDNVKMCLSCDKEECTNCLAYVPNSARKKGPSNRLIKMEGKRFGSWTVIEKAPRRENTATSYWMCRCDCGTVKAVSGTMLRGGYTKGCNKCKRNRTGAKKEESNG